ncbi:MAG: AAA family ATPase [Bacteroidales bacterium]|nr:AAA family ATPase [Bacteroidales bacterium]
MLYPIGIQNFEKMRTGGFVYVDKTAQIYKLAFWVYATQFLFYVSPWC